MYEVFHYKSDKTFAGSFICNSPKELSVYKEVKVSKGERIFIYDSESNDFVGSFSK